MMGAFPLLSFDDAQANNLGFLQISGNKIINSESNKPVFLRGLALSNGVFNDKGSASSEMPSWALNEDDVVFFKKMGASVVRYCFSYKWLLDDKGFEKLDEHLKLFEKHGIYVILNMHIPPGSGSEWGKSVGDELFVKENWDIFVQIWEKIAKRYRGRAVIAAYEPFSEPKPKTYDQLVAKTKEIVAAIRKIEANDKLKHIIIVTRPEALRENGVTTFKSYPLFELDEPNILYTFHFYEPWAFTHQPEAKDLYWLDAEQKENLPQVYHYPTECSWMVGQYSREQMEKVICSHVKWAEENNVPLYVGEFGATNRAPIEDKKKWLADVLAILAKYNIPAWTYWDYKNAYGWRYDFSLVNVLPNNFEEHNVWSKAHIKQDIKEVNKRGQQIIALLRKYFTKEVNNQ